jgi:hypothetical protein
VDGRNGNVLQLSGHSARLRPRWSGFEDVAERIKRSKFAATSDTAISSCPRLFGTRERQSVMLATLLIIVASIAAGMIVNHVHPEYRKW